MGSKQDKQLADLYSQLLGSINHLNDPKSNPGQEYLTNQALAGAEYFKKGEYGTLPTGMFFDFKMPGQQLDQYKKYADVNQGGTFALAEGGDSGRSKATGLQDKYLKDKFARDASQNYQDNISNAANNVYGALGQSAGASAANNGAVIGALGNMYSSLASRPQQPSIWGSILGAAGQVGASAITRW